MKTIIKYIHLKRKFFNLPEYVLVKQLPFAAFATTGYPEQLLAWQTPFVVQTEAEQLAVNNPL